MGDIKLKEKDMDRMRELNRKSGYRINRTQLLRLITAHEKARNSNDKYTMELLEYRLTQINYHYENGFLCQGKYAELRKSLEVEGEKKNYGKEYLYNGEVFIPYCKAKAGFRMSVDRGLNLNNYNYEAFYKAMDNSIADVFMLKRNGRLYIPSTNTLMLYESK